MRRIEATGLVSADRGVEIVASVPDGLTYVGWFERARARGPWVMAELVDHRACKISVLLKHDWPVQINPFPILEVGHLVVRRGWSDPESAHFHSTTIGEVTRLARDKDQNRILLVRWTGQGDPRWHTRRMLEPATAEILDEIRRS